MNTKINGYELKEALTLKEVIAHETSLGGSVDAVYGIPKGMTSADCGEWLVESISIQPMCESNTWCGVHIVAPSQ